MAAAHDPLLVLQTQTLRRIWKEQDAARGEQGEQSTQKVVRRPSKNAVRGIYIEVQHAGGSLVDLIPAVGGAKAPYFDEDGVIRFADRTVPDVNRILSLLKRINVKRLPDQLLRVQVENKLCLDAKLRYEVLLGGDSTGVRELEVLLEAHRYKYPSSCALVKCQPVAVWALDCHNLNNPADVQLKVSDVPGFIWADEDERSPDPPKQPRTSGAAAGSEGPEPKRQSAHKSRHAVEADSDSSSDEEGCAKDGEDEPSLFHVVQGLKEELKALRSGGEEVLKRKLNAAEADNTALKKRVKTVEADNLKLWDEVKLVRSLLEARLPSRSTPPSF